MKERYLEAGRIVNTHGVRGEVKIQPWADSADFLKGFSVFYIDGKPFSVRSSYVHKGCLIASLDGVGDMDAAEALKGSVIRIDRNDAHLEPGAYFLNDLIGLRAVEEGSGRELGTVGEILDLPGGAVLVIRGKKEILVPCVPAFVAETAPDEGFVKIRLIEGME